MCEVTFEEALKREEIAMDSLMKLHREGHLSNLELMRKMLSKMSGGPTEEPLPEECQEWMKEQVITEILEN